jgi:hypothetical protein
MARVSRRIQPPARVRMASSSEVVAALLLEVRFDLPGPEGPGIAAQESIVRGGCGDESQRASRLRIGNLQFVLWHEVVRRQLIGVLYDVSLTGLIDFCVATQRAAVPLLLMLGARAGTAPPEVQ